MTEQQRRGLIVCVSGPSGVGKGTVIAEIMQRETALTHSISVTTRPPRPGEVEGQSYYFRSKDAFEAMLASEQILEHDCYCDNYYGTPSRPLEAQIEQGKDVLLDITIPGSIKVMERFAEAITIFLLPPSFSELERRLRRRGTECDKTVRKRMDKAREEIGQTALFQYVVVNDDLQVAADNVLAIVKAEHCRYQRLTGIENTILDR